MESWIPKLRFGLRDWLSDNNAMNDRVLAIIPARGGSKRIKEKNIREVGGKPLIAHTIEQVDRSSFIDKSVISTDCDKIENVAKEYGGNVPFERPSNLATDTSPTSEAINHALDWFEARDEEFDVVCVVQVTSPLRAATDLDEGLSALETSSATSVVAVSEYLTPPYWAVTMDDKGRIQPRFESCPLWESDTVRSQDLQTLYHPNGSFFAAYVDVWNDKQSFYTSDTLAHVMPPMRGFDIDEPWELEMVRGMM